MTDYQQFIVIRHGESQTNATNTFQAGNQYDSDPLTPLGSEDASRLAERLAALPVNLIISSSYLRARAAPRARSPRRRGPRTSSRCGRVRHGWICRQTTRTSRTIPRSCERSTSPANCKGLPFHDPQAREIQHAAMAVADKPDGRFSDEENLYDLWRRAEEIRRYLEARPERLAVVVSHGGILKFGSPT